MIWVKPPAVPEPRIARPVSSKEEGGCVKSMSLLLTVAGMLVAGAALAQSADELLKAKGCLGCHAMDVKKVGPAYKDVAAKYKDDKKAEGKLVAALKEGKGHPIKAAASEAELKKMVKRVLSAK